MPVERFFHPEKFHAGSFIELNPEEALHATKVLRLKENDQLEIANGMGELANGVISKIGKKNVQVQIKKVIQQAPEKNKIILAQSIVKPNRLDWILEKATEIGVDDIWLFPAENSYKQDLSEQQTKRAWAILIAALKQSGRLYLPKLIVKEPLKKWQSFPEKFLYADFCSDTEHLISIKLPQPEIVIFIGPEAGWSESERSLFKKNQGQIVHLHKNILRTDTAAILALSILVSKLQS